MNRTPEEIIQDVDDLVRAVWTDWENPEKLSEDLMKLAVLYTPIGNLLAEARDDERREEADYKYRVEVDKLDHIAEGDTATKAESKAKVQHREQQKIVFTLTRQSEALKFKREDVEKLIDAARSRLSLIKGDLRRT